MKRSTLFALGLCAVPFFFASCSDDDDDDPEWTDLVSFEYVGLGQSQYNDTSAYVYADILVFENNHATWGSYFGVSAKTDTTTAGYLNDASIFGKGGNAGSANFAYCYYSEYSGVAPTIKVKEGNAAGVTSFVPNRVYMALTTYAALALRDGNDGGVYGDAVKLKNGGYFSVTFTGYNGKKETGTVTVYPGDYRGANLYLMTSWTPVDLSFLGEVTSIGMTIGGSEDLYGQYGFNAPAYIAIDDFSFTRMKADK